MYQAILRPYAPHSKRCVQALGGFMLVASTELRCKLCRAATNAWPHVCAAISLFARQGCGDEIEEPILAGAAGRCRRQFAAVVSRWCGPMTLSSHCRAVLASSCHRTLHSTLRPFVLHFAAQLERHVGRQPGMQVRVFPGKGSAALWHRRIHDHAGQCGMLAIMHPKGNGAGAGLQRHTHADGARGRRLRRLL